MSRNRNGSKTRGVATAHYRKAMSNFQFLDSTGSSSTEIFGINTRGDLVGVYRDSSGASHAFLLSNGELSIIDVPGAFNTIPFGINSEGDITGAYDYNCCVSHGFLLSRSTLTTIDVPPSGTVWTVPQRINPEDEIVGVYSGTNYPNHGFLLSRGTFTTPSTRQMRELSEVKCLALTRKEILSGFQDYPTAAFVFHGFLLSDGTFTVFDVPGANSTTSRAVSPSGNIVGTYCITTPTYACHGFLYGK